MSKAKQLAAQRIEKFSNESEVSERPYALRQDRFSIPDFRAFLVIENKSYPIINYSSFGVAISSPATFAADFKVESAELVVEGFHVQTISIVKVREALQEDDTYKVAFEVCSEPIQMEKLAALPEILRLTLALQEEFTHTSKLPLAFVATVYEIKDLISKANDRVTDLHKSRGFSSRQEVDEFENIVIDVVGKVLHEVLTTTNDKMAVALDGQPEQIVKACYHFFREQLKSGIYQSAFAKRSLTKPLGYPGDYELMNIIYRNEDIGQTLFGRCMERAFVGHDEPQAVRNRTDYMTEKIATLLRKKGSETIRALSVGCGPAREVQMLVEQLDQSMLDRFHIELMDQDAEALKYAQKQIKKIALKHNKKLNIVYTQQSVKSVLLKGLQDGPYDLIYSMGLFDYFTDQVARLAGKQFFASLTKNGKMIIGNFDVGSPHRIGMEIVFDWSLIYRSRTELAGLFSFPESKTAIESEKNGINIFSVTDKY